jgi:hypothetical protein
LSLGYIFLPVHQRAGSPAFFGSGFNVICSSLE